MGLRGWGGGDGWMDGLVGEEEFVDCNAATVLLSLFLSQWLIL